MLCAAQMTSARRVLSQRANQVAGMTLAFVSATNPVLDCIGDALNTTQRLYTALSTRSAFFPRWMHEYPPLSLYRRERGFHEPASALVRMKISTSF